MYIVINCGGMPFNGDTIKEKSLGGSETAAYYLAKELVAQGHHVVVFTNSKDEGFFDGVQYVYCGEMTQQTPMGNKFHFYAKNTLHDVLIIQRHPAAFVTKWASKINILWLHDLATKRSKNDFGGQMWNIDIVWTVSKFHKEQVQEIYGFAEKIVQPIQNGVDLGLYAKTYDPVQVQAKNGLHDFTDYGGDPFIQANKIKFIYSSRPERGLENHVKPDGIMARLWEIDKRFHLYVCGYDNTVPVMAEYYNQLWAWCEQAPNVTNLGSLTKQELADVQRQCDACVYPTQFEEVSCITAMECMAAEIPFISSSCAALPETCEGSGSVLIPLKDDAVDCDCFVKNIVDLFLHKESKGKVPAIKMAQGMIKDKYTWRSATMIALNTMRKQFEQNKQNAAGVAKHLLNNSDIYALYKYLDRDQPTDNSILSNVYIELQECYSFMNRDDWSDHYEKYYQYEKDKGVVYGPEDVSHTHRFKVVSNFLKELPEGSRVLDYGCAHGHYTVNLAKLYPGLIFVGIDIAQSNIDIAKKWAVDDKVVNVAFYCGQVESIKDLVLLPGNFDVAIVAEVLEHVANPQKLLSDIRDNFLKDQGMFVLTTPYGPWEAIGYEKEWPWRAHVHHFERADIQDIAGHFPDFTVFNIAEGNAPRDMGALGSYVWAFTCPKVVNLTEQKEFKLMQFGQIDYERKFNTLPSTQTMSLCMIVKDAESCIKRCLDGVGSNVDEMILAVDSSTTDNTKDIILQWVGKHTNKPIVSMIDIPQIVDTPAAQGIGFDAARNLSIDQASGDWILWIDSDEEIHNAEGIRKYLRNNQFDGYGIAQHHFAVQPPGLIKSDFPCRLFRNNIGIQFFGVVHEHPSKNTCNEGVGFVQILGDVSLTHHAYATEASRRERFNRNLGLMARDRDRYPDRWLGKFLWIRDLSQMTKYDMEQTRGRITLEMIKRAEEAIGLWEELLEANQLRMLMDGMDYYSFLVNLLGLGFEFGFTVGASKMNGGMRLAEEKPVLGKFHSIEFAKKFINKVVDMRLEGYDSKYF